jgi:hypothetical protein
MIRRSVFAAALSVVLLCSTLLAVDGDKAMYVGGTVQIKENMEGKLDTSNDKTLTFAYKRLTWTLDYGSIVELEYGQKAGRRVAVGVLVSPFALFSKKRNHYLTISFKDLEGKEQAVVFELGKDIVRPTLKVLQVRSGKEIHFQDEEARKSIGGDKG